ncbi:hypothetical protein DPMN_048921 [Dreissena polymorpha]|uniref:Uncharacterized protein n=1 Tax=Dreissena polymorpha TaxID=45954 RepID=A0A9D4DCI3_DREPO|nr:hypothetical protein DPMN_048921 [Dreissena polymorpha]
MSQFGLCECAVKWGAQLRFMVLNPRSTTAAVPVGMIHISWTCWKIINLIIMS